MSVQLAVNSDNQNPAQPSSMLHQANEVRIDIPQLAAQAICGPTAPSAPAAPREIVLLNAPQQNDSAPLLPQGASDSAPARVARRDRPVVEAVDPTPGACGPFCETPLRALATTVTMLIVAGGVAFLAAYPKH